VVGVVIEVELVNCECVRNVLEEDHEDVRPVEHLRLDLGPLLHVEVLQDAQDFLDDRANLHDRLHVFLIVLEVIQIVGEDLPNNLFSDHLAHFVTAQVFINLNEQFTGEFIFLRLLIRINLHLAIFKLLLFLSNILKSLIFPAMNLSFNDTKHIPHYRQKLEVIRVVLCLSVAHHRLQLIRLQEIWRRHFYDCLDQSE